MVAVLSGPGTPTAEARVHFALTVCPGHAFAVLLAAEAPDRVAAPDVPVPTKIMTTMNWPGTATAARTQSNISRRIP
jgi:hypothetical protein